ncbi:glycosyl hydrolase [Vibrio sp. C8]
MNKLTLLVGLLTSFGVYAQHDPIIIKASKANQYSGVLVSQNGNYVKLKSENEGYIEFVIWSPHYGEQSLDIKYSSSDITTVALTVNNDSPTTLLLNGNGSFNSSNKYQTSVSLNSGVNTLRIGSVPTSSYAAPAIYSIAIEHSAPACSTSVDSDSWGWENKQSCHGIPAYEQVTNCSTLGGKFTAADESISSEAKSLLAMLSSVSACDKFAFGAEFPLSYSHEGHPGSNSDTKSSDLKAISNKFGAVHGTDPNYMLYREKKERMNHIRAAREDYENGAIITMDFHHKGGAIPKVWADGSEKLNENNKNYLSHIIQDIDTLDANWKQGEAEKYKDRGKNALYSLLKTWEEIIDIINNGNSYEGEIVSGGTPVVLRLYHEMNGDWFWWGSSAELAPNYDHQGMYIKLYKYIVNYIKKNTNNVLFAWSPDTGVGRDFGDATKYYPTDEADGTSYVDIVGMDLYDQTDLSEYRNQIGQLVDFSILESKVPAITEIGDRSGNDYRTNHPNFWNGIVLEAIKHDPANKAQKIAYMQTWMHAQFNESARSLVYFPLVSDYHDYLNLCAADDNNTECLKHVYRDFKDFSDDSDTIFRSDLRNLTMSSVN